MFNWNITFSPSVLFFFLFVYAQLIEFDVLYFALLRFCALVKRRREGVSDSAASVMVPPVAGNAISTHHCVPDDIDPELVFFCRHVYDFRYGRLLKNLH